VSRQKNDGDAYGEKDEDHCDLNQKDVRPTASPKVALGAALHCAPDPLAAGGDAGDRR